MLNAAFVSVYTSKNGFQESQAPAARVKVWCKEDLYWGEQSQVREQLDELVICKFVRSDVLHLWVLMELADAIVRWLDYFEMIVAIGKADTIHVFSNSKKKAVGNFRLVDFSPKALGDDRGNPPEKDL